MTRAKTLATLLLLSALPMAAVPQAAAPKATTPPTPAPPAAASQAAAPQASQDKPDDTERGYRKKTEKLIVAKGPCKKIDGKFENGMMLFLMTDHRWIGEVTAYRPSHLFQDGKTREAVRIRLADGSGWPTGRTPGCRPTRRGGSTSRSNGAGRGPRPARRTQRG
jgi:hypothetical protein